MKAFKRADPKSSYHKGKKVSFSYFFNFCIYMRW